MHYTLSMSNQTNLDFSPIFNTEREGYATFNKEKFKKYYFNKKRLLIYPFVYTILYAILGFVLMMVVFGALGESSPTARSIGNAVLFLYLPLMPLIYYLRARINYRSNDEWNQRLKNWDQFLEKNYFKTNPSLQVTLPFGEKANRFPFFDGLFKVNVWPETIFEGRINDRRFTYFECEYNDDRGKAGGYHSAEITTLEFPLQGSMPYFLIYNFQDYINLYHFIKTREKDTEELEYSDVGPKKVKVRLEPNEKQTKPGNINPELLRYLSNLEMEICVKSNGSVAQIMTPGLTPTRHDNIDYEFFFESAWQILKLLED